MKKDIVMSFRVTEEMNEDLKAIAERSNNTVSKIINQAIEFFLWANENIPEDTWKEFYYTKYGI